MFLNPASFKTTDARDDLSIRYANAQDKYAALSIFPVHAVLKNVGKFYSYSKDNLRVRSLEAPHGSEAQSSGYSVSSRNFSCIPHAHKSLVLNADARDFDRPIADLDNEAVMQNMDALLLELEADMYTKVSTTANYPAALVSTLVDSSTRWSDANGDPLEDVRAIREAVFVACGKRPNKMALSGKGLETLKLNAAVVERVKHTGLAVTPQILATLLELESIVVSDVIKNSAIEGAADSLAAVWGDEALVFYQDPGARLKSMTFGKCFMVSQLGNVVIDAPELGRKEGAHFLESSWEYDLEFCATVSSSDGDAVAGGLIDNIF